LQFGQTAWATYTSSEISSTHLSLARGYWVPPGWFTFVKHPFAVLHWGSP
jgi:hypothetical protein